MCSTCIANGDTWPCDINAFSTSDNPLLAFTTHQWRWECDGQPSTTTHNYSRMKSEQRILRQWSPFRCSTLTNVSKHVKNSFSIWIPRQTTLNGFFPHAQIATAIAKPQSPTRETDDDRQKKEKREQLNIKSLHRFWWERLRGRWRIRMLSRRSYNGTRCAQWFVY